MKLFTKLEMQTLESSAAQSITLAQMMENAGTALAEEARQRWGPIAGKKTALLCGKGNNGGDGFVCARALAESGGQCTVVLVQGAPATSLAQEAFAKLPKEVDIIDYAQSPAAARAALASACLIADCVFGFSFQGQLRGDAAALLAYANTLPAHKLSADLPSGTECDTGRASPDTFQADVTVAFTAAKPAHWCYPAKAFCGETVVRQVGVPADLLSGAETTAVLTDRQFVKTALKPAAVQANKGSQGRLLLVCGSYGMAGACVMAARAALRCGVGLLDIAAERSIYPILAGAVPEAVFTIYDAGNFQAARRQLQKALSQCTACAVGCGLGELADLLCPIVFENCPAPLLIDADALNFCARAGFPTLAHPAVLTPHPGEMARLTGKSIPEIQTSRIEAALSLAEKTGAAVLLKGAGTVIASPQGRFTLNPTGNPGMAKGGSGDALAGVAGALLAQGTPAWEAAAAGAYLHGAAGDLCRERLSARAMLPTDLPAALPEIFKNFERP